MPRLLYDIRTALAALAGGLLLAPLVASSIMDGRWAVMLLALVSALMILGSAKTGDKYASTTPLWLLALTLLFVGLAVEIDKVRFLAGSVLIAAAMLYRTRLTMAAKTAIFISTAFIVPLPAEIETGLATLLAEAEASLFTALGQLAGLPVRQMGAQILTGDAAVTINRDCSGTLLILPALLGGLVGCQVSPDRGRALFALLLAVPFALLINTARIGVLLMLTLEGSPELVDAWHDTLGWLAMSIVWLVPLLIARPARDLPISFPTARMRPLALALAPGLIWFAVSAVSTPYHLRANLESVPLYVSGWVGSDEMVPQEEARILNADTLLRRRYVDPTGDRTLILTAIYHRDPAKAREHSSARCFRAMGWQVERDGMETIDQKTLLEALLVHHHLGSQAVTEITTPHHGTGTLRLQLVEEAHVPQKIRRETAIKFLEATLNSRSRTS